MNEHSSEWPLDFQAFHGHRNQFLDGLAADRLLREIETAAVEPRCQSKERRVDPIVVEGHLSIIVEERRMIIGYFAPGQRDLADLVRAGLGADAEAFGLVDAGDVRITVEFARSGNDEPLEEDLR